MEAGIAGINDVVGAVEGIYLRLVVVGGEEGMEGKAESE